MLYHYFQKPVVLTGIKSENFKAYLDSFAQELDAIGFAREHVRNQLRAAAHVCVWAEKQRMDVHSLDIEECFGCPLSQFMGDIGLRLQPRTVSASDPASRERR